MFSIPKRVVLVIFLLLSPATTIYADMYNITDQNNNNFSPVTYNNKWPKVWRLLIMVTLAIFGTIFNVFFVSSFFVVRPLRRAGLVYLACIGLTDMLITSVLLPLTSLVLLADWDSLPFCNVVHCIGMSAVYCCSLFFLLNAIEEYLRVCCPRRFYGIINRNTVAITAIAVFALSFALGYVGVYFDLDYDYCERLHYGNTYYRVFSVILLHVIPCIFTFYYLFEAKVSVSVRADAQRSYRRSHEYIHDKSIAALNLKTYAAFVIVWIPYLIISFKFLSKVSDDTFYNSIWFGHGRAVITSCLYSILDHSFRRGSSYLFNYYCCNTNLSYEQTPRDRREYSTRVHIFQPDRVGNAQTSLAGRARAERLIRETQHL